MNSSRGLVQRQTFDMKNYTQNEKSTCFILGLMKVRLQCKEETTSSFNQLFF